jgi:hypothetical protein
MPAAQNSPEWIGPSRKRLQDDRPDGRSASQRPGVDATMLNETAEARRTQRKDATVQAATGWERGLVAKTCGGGKSPQRSPVQRRSSLKAARLCGHKPTGRNAESATKHTKHTKEKGRLFVYFVFFVVNPRSVFPPCPFPRIPYSAVPLRSRTACVFQLFSFSQFHLFEYSAVPFPGLSGLSAFCDSLRLFVATPSPSSRSFSCISRFCGFPQMPFPERTEIRIPSPHQMR